MSLHSSSLGRAGVVPFLWGVSSLQVVIVRGKGSRLFS